MRQEHTLNWGGGHPPLEHEMAQNHPRPHPYRTKKTAITPKNTPDSRHPLEKTQFNIWARASYLYHGPYINIKGVLAEVPIRLL